MTLAERELIEEKFKGVYRHQEANFDSMSIQLGEILDLTKSNQAEIKRVKDQTRITRWVERNPKAAILIGILLLSGGVAIGTLIGWNTIISKLI